MGQERCRAMPKDDLSPAKTRSKIGHHRVRKKGEDKTSPFSFTLRRGRCFGGASADFSSLYKCAVLLRNIRILIEKSSVQINLTSTF